MAFDRYRSGPPRISRWVIPVAEATRCRPHDLRVAFSALSHPPEHLAAPRRHAPASLGVRPAPPPYSESRPLPVAPVGRSESSFGTPPSGRRYHPSTPVPSSWSRTTSTVSSANPVASLLHLAAGHGVRRVFRLPVPDCTRRYAEHGRRPRDASPFEESPSPSAVPRHRGRCLLAVSARVRPASNDLSILAQWPVRSKSVGTTGIPREREPANGRMHVPEGPVDEAPIPRRTGGPPRHRVQAPCPLNPEGFERPVAGDHKPCSTSRRRTGGAARPKPRDSAPKGAPFPTPRGRQSFSQPEGWPTTGPLRANASAANRVTTRGRYLPYRVLARPDVQR
jgi:hypothetical protein